MDMRPQGPKPDVKINVYIRLENPHDSRPPVSFSILPFLPQLSWRSSWASRMPSTPSLNEAVAINRREWGEESERERRRGTGVEGG